MYRETVLIRGLSKFMLGPLAYGSLFPFLLRNGLCPTLMKSDE